MPHFIATGESVAPIVVKSKLHDVVEELGSARARARLPLLFCFIFILFYFCIFRDVEWVIIENINKNIYLTLFGG